MLVVLLDEQMVDSKVVELVTLLVVTKGYQSAELKEYYLVDNSALPVAADLADERVERMVALMVTSTVVTKEILVK